MSFKKVVFLIPFLLLINLTVSIGQTTLNDYLPNIRYNKSVPTPEQVLGFPVGKWHVRHDQVVRYFEELADASPRVRLIRTGKTHEERSLLLAVITSPDNQSSLKEIKAKHLELSQPEKSKSLDVDKMPVVIYQGYSIHGNEPSGTNASLLYAYYLAAAEDEKVLQLLSDAVVLLDPSLNPDGLSRFAQWANSHKGMQAVADPWNREHQEMNPSGRTNHYWFDLNRDWLLLQHPESQARVRQFHAWKPNVLTDHHEMGTNSTYFFQPGIPSRNNPLTPSENFRLTENLSRYFAKSLDEIGSLYFTKESFDDFYYGKGSTYPDINGGVGILFEQASSRGHIQEGDFGELTFPFTIKNQLLTSMATLEGAVEMKSQLLNYQRDFYRGALRSGRKSKAGGYVFGEKYDKTRLYNFVNLLRAHDIEVLEVNKDFEGTEGEYISGKSYVVPLEQAQYGLVEAIFDKPVSFKDSLFYDVSGWTLPLAFNLQFEEVSDRNFRRLKPGQSIDSLKAPAGQVFGGKSDYAYLFSWDDYNAPRVLNKLLENDLRVYAAAQPFSVRLNERNQEFSYGTILIPVQNQVKNSNFIYKYLQEMSLAEGVDFYGINTGLTPQGIDIGSRKMLKIEKPEILVLYGEGVSDYETGEIWHLLDKQMGMSVTLADISYFNKVELYEYKTLILPPGSYKQLDEKALEKLKNWLNEGGQVLASQKSVKWLKKKEFIQLEYKTSQDSTQNRRSLPKSYEDLQKEKGAQLIGGAIFEVEIDPSHPVFFGYRQSRLPVFKNDTTLYKTTDNPYATPSFFAEKPLMSGYVSKEKSELIPNTAAVTVHRMGEGRIIGINFNPNFRAFWYGTNKLYLNSIFLGKHINKQATEKQPKEEKKE